MKNLYKNLINLIPHIVHYPPKNYIEKIEKLLQQGAPLNNRDEYGDTPLLSLLYFTKSTLYDYHIEAVKLLLKYGADVHVENNSGYTPLMYAAENIHMTKLLLDHGVNVNAVNQYKQTALMHAASKDFLEVFRLLLAYGADLQMQDDRFQTVLMYAIDSYPKRYRAAQFLLANYDSLDKQELSLVQEFLIQIKNDTSKNLIKVLIHQDFDNTYELFKKDYASELLAWIQELVESGQDISNLLQTNIKQQDENSIYDALYSVCFADILLYLAVWGSHSNLVEYLLRIGVSANIRSQRETLLIRAIRTQSLDIITQLLHAHADISIKDEMDRTALYYAKQSRNKEIINLLKAA